MTPTSWAQIAPSCLAAALNLLVLWSKVPVNRAARMLAKCVAFALLTAAMFHAGIIPTQRPEQLAMAPDIRFMWGVLEMSWWLLAASTTIDVIRTYYALAHRLRERRFMLDVVGTLLYLSAAVAIVTDVFNIPLRGVLATSGALAIVLGLALQSTLSDLFSGLVINMTTPYRIGDTISLDSSTEGQVVEITWRATHLLKTNRDLIVVPNSTIAKSRIVNSSVPRGTHATVVSFQTLPEWRPADVHLALRLALETCVGIAAQPAPSIVTKTIGWQSIDYEITFFVAESSRQVDVLNYFHDAAHRHLEALKSLTPPLDANSGGQTNSLEYQLIESVNIFGLLTQAERQQLATQLVRQEFTPGQVLLDAEQVPEAITIVAYGIVAASIRRGDAVTDILRLGPREYFGECGPIAGLPVKVDVVAKTFAIVYSLPGDAIARLMKEHPEVAHAFAARLAAREQQGRALLQPPSEIVPTEHGLANWITKCIRAFHHLR